MLGGKSWSGGGGGWEGGSKVEEEHMAGETLHMRNPSHAGRREHGQRQRAEGDQCDKI